MEDTLWAEAGSEEVVPDAGDDHDKAGVFKVWWGPSSVFLEV